VYSCCCTLICAGKLADNFVVGLTHVSPAVSAPVMWRYTLCAQYPGAVAPGATVSLRCRDKLPESRYVIVQFPAHTMVVCEIEVHVKGVGTSKIFTARGRGD